jgi:hypothetical protein
MDLLRTLGTVLTRGLVRWWTQVLLALLALPVKNTVDSWRLRAKSGGGNGAENRARLLGNAGQGEAGAERQLEGGIRIAGFLLKFDSAVNV